MNRLFEERPSFKRSLGYICLLTLLVLFFYWEVLQAYFNSQELQELQLAVDNANKWYLTAEYWRPVYYAFNHMMYISFGLNPLPYRLVNLILYISILPLLYHFYNQFFEDKTLSKIMVLLFATFYLHAEAISPFVTNGYLLRILFGLATLVCFVHYRKVPCLRYYILALLFSALTYLAHESSVFLPLLLLAADYHISHGIFPPRLQPLKDIGRNLLPHIPFWLLALALLGFTFMVPRRSITVDLVHTKTLYEILNQSYFLAIYTFAPCYLTDRLTIVLGLIIVGGIVWLFYRSTPQGRSLIATMTACTGFSLLPYIIAVPAPRYFFFSSVFSIPLTVLLALSIGSRVHRLFQERLQRYRLSADLTTASLALLILLPAIYLNYRDVRQYNTNTFYAGKLLREIVEGTTRILPQGPGESTIIYLNLPNTVHTKVVLSLDKYVAFRNWHMDALGLYYRHCNIPWIDRRHENENIKTIYLDLGYDRVFLSPKAWYDLLKTPVFALTLSAREFNDLSRDAKNKLLFFNPVTNKLVDVSGWNYEKLEGSIAPYRDKLNSVL